MTYTNYGLWNFSLCEMMEFSWIPIFLCKCPCKQFRNKSGCIQLDKWRPAVRTSSTHNPTLSIPHLGMPEHLRTIPAPTPPDPVDSNTIPTCAHVLRRCPDIFPRDSKASVPACSLHTSTPRPHLIPRTQHHHPNHFYSTTPAANFEPHLIPESDAGVE